MPKTIADKHYRVSNWSKGYFDVNLDGNLVVRPQRENSKETVPLVNIIKELKEKLMVIHAIFNLIF